MIFMIYVWSILWGGNDFYNINPYVGHIKKDTDNKIFGFNVGIEHHKTSFVTSLIVNIF